MKTLTFLETLKAVTAELKRNSIPSREKLGNLNFET